MSELSGQMAFYDADDYDCRECPCLCDPCLREAEQPDCLCMICSCACLIRGCWLTRLFGNDADCDHVSKVVTKDRCCICECVHNETIFRDPPAYVRTVPTTNPLIMNQPIIAPINAPAIAPISAPSQATPDASV